MSKEYCLVEVVDRPKGPGPNWVRDGWKGVRLRVSRRTERHKKCRDMVSGESFGPAETVEAPAIEAFRLLEKKQPDAYEWYKKHGYLELLPGATFLFNIEAVSPHDHLIRGK